jgi:hypothetical protein
VDTLTCLEKAPPSRQDAYRMTTDTFTSRQERGQYIIVSQRAMRAAIRRRTKKRGALPAIKFQKIQ